METSIYLTSKEVDFLGKDSGIKKPHIWQKKVDK